MRGVRNCEIWSRIFDFFYFMSFEGTCCSVGHFVPPSGHWVKIRLFIWNVRVSCYVCNAWYASPNFFKILSDSFYNNFHDSIGFRHVNFWYLYSKVSGLSIFGNIFYIISDYFNLSFVNVTYITIIYWSISRYVTIYEGMIITISTCLMRYMWHDPVK